MVLICFELLRNLCKKEKTYGQLLLTLGQLCIIMFNELLCIMQGLYADKLRTTDCVFGADYENI